MKRILIDPSVPGALALGESPRPEPLPHQAVVKVRAFSLNRGEITMAQHSPKVGPLGTLPFSMSSGKTRGLPTPHLDAKVQGESAKKTLFGRVGGASQERPLPREVHLIIIGPNGRELEAGPLGPVKDKPACGDLCAWSHSPPTPGN